MKSQAYNSNVKSSGKHICDISSITVRRNIAHVRITHNVRFHTDYKTINRKQRVHKISSEYVFWIIKKMYYIYNLYIIKKINIVRIHRVPYDAGTLYLTSDHSLLRHSCSGCKVYSTVNSWKPVQKFEKLNNWQCDIL